MQVHVDDILQVAANGFSAHEDPARRYSNGILGERRSHCIDVFAIVGLGETLLQIGILIVGALLTGSTAAPSDHHRCGKYDRTHHRNHPLSHGAEVRRLLHSIDPQHLVKPSLAVLFIECVDDDPHDPNPLSTQ
ncbi:hypothetical protein ACVWZK_001487 [Bradyrhizobium sp. GM0.4]